MALSTSVLSLATMSFGTRAGARMPIQLSTAYPLTVSDTVGMSGAAAERLLSVIASTRSRPDLMYGVTVGR